MTEDKRFLEEWGSRLDAEEKRLGRQLNTKERTKATLAVLKDLYPDDVIPDEVVNWLEVIKVTQSKMPHKRPATKWPQTMEITLEANPMKRHEFTGANYTEDDVKAMKAEWERRGYTVESYEWNEREHRIYVMLPSSMSDIDAYRLGFDVVASEIPDDEPYGDDDED